MLIFTGSADAVTPSGPTVATDTFNRANTSGTLGTADSGQVWSATQFEVNSNQARSTGSANAVARLECYNPDATVSVTMAVNSGIAGIIMRSAGTGYLRVKFDSGTLYLHEIAAVDTLLGSVAHTAANGDVLKAVCVGTSISVYVNNVLKISATSTFNQFATLFGLYAELNTAVRYDNFNITLPVSINVSDDFNRADDSTTLGTTSSGTSWRAVSGTWGVQTNRARQVTGGFAAATVAANQADCTIQVTLPVNSANGGGLAFRLTDINSFIRAAWNGGSLLLIKRVAGVDTTLSSVVFANVNGQVLKVVLAGSSIEVFVGGVSKLTATDGFNVLASQHGLFNGSSTSIRYDDFSIVA